MIRFNHNDSLINTDLVTPTGGSNFTCKVSFHFFIIIRGSCMKCRIPIVIVKIFFIIIILP